MAKNAKLTIYHTRSIQAKSYTTSATKIEKITLFSESGGRGGE